MRSLFVCGAVLLAFALIGAVAQSMASLGSSQDGGMLMSAYDVWYTLWPGNLVVSKIRIERLLGPWAWDPVLVTALAAPAWVLFGIPGMLLGWAGWLTRAPRTEEDIEDEDSVFLFDSLAAQAKAEAAEFAEFQRTLDAGEYDDVIGTTLRVAPPGGEAVDEADLPIAEIVEEEPADDEPAEDGTTEEGPADKTPKS